MDRLIGWLGWLYTGEYSSQDTSTPDINERAPSSAKTNAPEPIFLNYARMSVPTDFMLLRKLSDLAVYKLYKIINYRTNISNPASLMTELSSRPNTTIPSLPTCARDIYIPSSPFKGLTLTASTTRKMDYSASLSLAGIQCSIYLTI